MQPQETTYLVSDEMALLDGQDNAGVRLASFQKRAMQAVEVADVETVENTPMGCGPAQLILVKPSNRSGILHRGYIDGPRAKPLHKGMVRGVFIHVEAQRRHGSRWR